MRHRRHQPKSRRACVYANQLLTKKEKEKLKKEREKQKKKEQAAQKKATEPKDNTDKPKAVSYTHLTLPTNREV